MTLLLGFFPECFGNTIVSIYHWLYPKKILQYQLSIEYPGKGEGWPKQFQYMYLNARIHCLLTLPCVHVLNCVLRYDCHVYQVTLNAKKWFHIFLYLPDLIKFMHACRQMNKHHINERHALQSLKIYLTPCSNPKCQSYEDSDSETETGPKTIATIPTEDYIQKIIQCNFKTFHYM